MKSIAVDLLYIDIEKKTYLALNHDTCPVRKAVCAHGDVTSPVYGA